jgi:CheY-like chemotaxis protein
MGSILHLRDRIRARPMLARSKDRARRALRILLAYAGTTEREYLAVFLASRGYDVTACGNGKEALAHLATARFDLVVTGILMPQMDGLELLRALRRQDGPPVIAIVDGAGKMNAIYLRNATLGGAVATHYFEEAGNALLDSADWILRGRDAVIRDVVW